DDDQDQDVRRGQRADARLRADGEPGDDDGELAARHQRAAGPPASGHRDARAAGRPVAGGDLGEHGDDGQREGRDQHGRDVRRVRVQAEEDEEHRGEQVPQGRQQVVRALGDLLGQRDADEEGADGGRDLEVLLDARDQQRQPQHDQRQHLGVVGRDGAADDPPVAQGDVEDGADGAQGDQQGEAAAREAHPGQQGGEDRQVDGHGEVLEDQHAEDHGGFPVADPAEIAEHLGDDARGRDPRHAGQGNGTHRAPAEQQGGDGAGRGVQDEVDRAGGVLRLEGGDEVGGAVLQAQHEQQQDDADLRTGGDELLTGLQGQDAAVAEGQSGEQVQGYGRETDPSGEAAQQAEGEDDRAEFDEHGRGVVH